MGVLGGLQIVEFILNIFCEVGRKNPDVKAYFTACSNGHGNQLVERCKLYGQSIEHGLVRYYPVNDGREQLK